MGSGYIATVACNVYTTTFADEGLAMILAFSMTDDNHLQLGLTSNKLGTGRVCFLAEIYHSSIFHLSTVPRSMNGVEVTSILSRGYAVLASDKSQETRCD